jgi:hypothetical protein
MSWIIRAESRKYRRISPSRRLNLKLREDDEEEEVTYEPPKKTKTKEKAKDAKKNGKEEKPKSEQIEDQIRRAWTGSAGTRA